MWDLGQSPIPVDLGWRLDQSPQGVHDAFRFVLLEIAEARINKDNGEHDCAAAYIVGDEGDSPCDNKDDDKDIFKLKQELKPLRRPGHSDELVLAMSSESSQSLLGRETVLAGAKLIEALLDCLEIEVGGLHHGHVLVRCTLPRTPSPGGNGLRRDCLTEVTRRPPCQSNVALPGFMRVALSTVNCGSSVRRFACYVAFSSP